MESHAEANELETDEKHVSTTRNGNDGKDRARGSSSRKTTSGNVGRGTSTSRTRTSGAAAAAAERQAREEAQAAAEAQERRGQQLEAELRATEPWERQIGESDEAWAAFQLYRELPKRSQLQLAKSIAAQQGRNESTVLRQVAEWSAHWQWVERCRAYDNDRDKAAREKMLREHVAHLQSARQTLAQPIAVMVDILRAEPMLTRVLANLLVNDLHSGKASAFGHYERLMNLIARTSQIAAMLIPPERMTHGMSATNVAVGTSEDQFDGEIARRTLGEIDDDTAAMVRAVLLRAAQRSSAQTQQGDAGDAVPGTLAATSHTADGVYAAPVGKV